MCHLFCYRAVWGWAFVWSRQVCLISAASFWHELCAVSVIIDKLFSSWVFMGGWGFTRQTAADDAKVVWKCSAVSLSTEYCDKLKLWTLNGLACFYEQIHKQALRVIGHAPYRLLLLTHTAWRLAEGGGAACEEREKRFSYLFWIFFYLILSFSLHCQSRYFY